MRTAGTDTVSTEIIEADSRIFLEVTRFDRVHAHGRRPVVTLASADAEFAGVSLHWPTIARELVVQRRLTSDDAERINRVHAFGLLIANTDMHNGNLALTHEEYGIFRLAPIFDMLPMRYAPVGGEVSTPEFIPPPPTGGGLGAGYLCPFTDKEAFMFILTGIAASANCLTNTTPKSWLRMQETPDLREWELEQKRYRGIEPVATQWKISNPLPNSPSQTQGKKPLQFLN